MLEDFIPSAAQQLRSMTLGLHLDAFCLSLSELGYRDQTIREKLWTVARLSRWMTTQRLGAVDLDERRVDEFIGAQRRRGRRRRGVRQTLLRLLAQLRKAGAVPMPTPGRDDAPGASLVARYVEHLKRERALAASTITGYLAVVCAFVNEHIAGAATRLDSLVAGDARDFLLARVGRMAPRRVQYMGTALRSFLRFLFLRGESSADLSLAVPTVRQARLVSVPRHLAPEDVERLLGSCDRSSATGRRDHAILLLLARLGLRTSDSSVE
jgi:hypothetical protein